MYVVFKNEKLELDNKLGTLVTFIVAFKCSILPSVNERCVFFLTTHCMEMI